jgi:hypothetical protein
VGRLEEGSTGCLAVREVTRVLSPARLGSLKGRVGEVRARWSIVRAHRAGFDFQGAAEGVGR